MAGHEWEDWFEREEFIGQISDIRVQNLQVERELVQKRTFTRWMNLHLEKCVPPIEVHDLFRDIQDGHVLMALLEELSGCKLLHGFKKSSHRIFRLNNIAKVLSFLEERNVKLVSIDAADVADGNSSIVLGLIWNIILFFQIKELTGNIRSQFPSSSSLSSIPTSSDSDASYCSTPSDERRSASTAMREQSKAIKKLLQWVQKRTRKYGVAVQDFGKSWTSGLAFLAVIKSIDPSLVDMRKALLRTAKENLEDGFRIAHYSLGIPRLLEPEDVSINTPDEQSIMTYVSQFLEHFPGIEEPEEPCQLIERSVSMGRLNFRDSEANQIRNSAHRSQVKERSYMFQRASAHPPPKILISSVSEDRSAMSPPFRPAAKRSWSSEDFLADPPNVEGISSSSVVEDPNESAKEPSTNSTSNSPHLSYTHSPTSSSAPESVNAESVIGDSAISSPDSWVESEFGVKFCESQSDSSLCDSGTAWDVYRATPIEVTTIDEGFVQSMDDRGITESYVDEGIYSLSSLESTQDRIQVPSEKKQKEVGKEFEASPENQDMVPDHKKADVTEEVDSKQVDSSQEPSFGLCEAEELANKADKSDHTSVEESPDSECLKKAVDFIGDAQDHEGQVNGQTNSEEFEVGPESLKKGSLSEETSKEAGILKERGEEVIETQDDASKDDPRDLDVQEILANTHPTNQDSQASKTCLDQSMGLNIPLISISSEPDEPEEEGTQERRDPAGDDEGHDTDVKGDVETPSCLVSENVKPAASEQTKETESQHLDEHAICGPDARDEAAIHEAKREHETCDHVNTESDSISQLSEAVNIEQEVESFDQPDGHQSKLCDIFSDSETTSTQQNSVDPVNSEPNGTTGLSCLEPDNVSRDSFYSDFDQSVEDGVVDAVEPMDLFYPDKEESMFTEPPDTEMQSWPSVLSVSALQPALASETQSDQPLGLLGADFRGGVDSIQEDDETNQEPYEASDSQENTLLPVETMGIFWDVPADGSDLSVAEQHSSSSAKENTEPVRSGFKSSSGQDGSQIPPVLRHRKGALFMESTDRRTGGTPATTEDDETDFDLCELHVVLLLWLLLYCFWLLPQMDLKTLPGLLLNLRR